MQEPRLTILDIVVPISTLELDLFQCGDLHYGVRGVNLETFQAEAKKEFGNSKDKFLVLTGDFSENNIAGSPGHGYDIELKDPQKQIEAISSSLRKVSQLLYGSAWKAYDGTTNGCRCVGVIGNHEYRSRKASGLWITEQQYGPGKIYDARMAALLRLKLINRKLKLERTYTVYLSHRPYQSDASTLESIIRQCRRKKADIAADIYCYGHFHRKVAIPDACFDADGRFRKVMYLVNPSPMCNIEYADWAGYSPLNVGWFQKIKLPIDPALSPYTEV